MNENDYVVHPMVYVVRSPNIASTLYYTTYSKMLDALKRYEHLSRADGSDAQLTIEFAKGMRLHKDFDEDTQSIRGFGGI